MSELTSAAIYKSDRDELLKMMDGGETIRQKIHELILNEKKRMKGGNEDGIRKEEESKG